MRILVLGAGRMGAAVVYDLLRSRGVERVGVVDNRLQAFKSLRRLLRGLASDRLHWHRLEAASEPALVRLLRGYDATVCALPYRKIPRVTRAALRARVPVCDLGGSHEVRAVQQRLHAQARGRGVAVVPDCGLAPGLTSVLVADGARAFTRLQRIRLLVGGLPQKPQPPLDYALFFSPAGLINEYAEPVEVVRGGRRLKIEPLSGLKALRVRGFPPLEAFYTSGGSSTLPQTFREVRELEEKTIRYQGHCEKMRALRALGLFSSIPVTVGGQRVSPRALLEHLLQASLASNVPDVVLAQVVLEGQTRKGRRRLHYEVQDYFDRRSGLTAMMRTTAFPASIAAQWLAQGRLPAGVHSPEAALPPGEFLREMRQRGLRIKRRWAKA